jgi:hypothetical protein
MISVSPAVSALKMMGAGDSSRTLVPICHYMTTLQQMKFIAKWVGDFHDSFGITWVGIWCAEMFGSCRNGSGYCGADSCFFLR